MGGRSGRPRGDAGAGFVVVANRLPRLVATAGAESPKAGAGGLVTAMEPVLRQHGGAWVGWSETADAEVRASADGTMTLHPVPLSATEVQNYYEGFSNATLWPLYHDAIVAPAFHRTWWDAYVQVNRRFARAAADIAAEGATVWVQDYQLQLVPSMLRRFRPDLRIGFFLHIPFPPTELFMRLPWRVELLQGLLGADLIGFQSSGAVRNFTALAGRLLDEDVSDRVGAFPISVDPAPLVELARTSRIAGRTAEIRARLGRPGTVLLGVDRLDYTKGIDVRLRAFEELLAEGRLSPGEVTMVQVATPSRERVEHYERLRSQIEGMVGRINGRFGSVGRPVVHYLNTAVDLEELVALYCAADVMLVTPLRDGMNLVSKEYVVSREDLGGALVLSEFAGAAHELTHAYLINPHHVDGVKSALLDAVRQSPAEGRLRMDRMRRHVLSHDLARWSTSFLESLHGVRLRQAI